MNMQVWKNPEEIADKLNRLWEMPARRLKPAAIEGYMRYFEEHCQKSKILASEACKYIPGAVQHNLSLNYPFPVCMAKAEGAYMWDVDGNRYTDFLQAGGPTMIGSNDPYVREKVIEVMNNCGAVTGLFSEYELKLAKLINRHMPHVEMFRMLASGTEANMAAIRLARAFTGCTKIIKICAAYHGWSDQLEYDITIAGSHSENASGIPKEVYMHTQAVPVNDLDAMREQLEKNRKDGGTACVIVEPFGPESGARPVYFDYNRKLRELCNEFGALLIFDEVVTGFRVGLGGAAAFFGVTPDITVFGKALTGGYPASGGVGGRREIMQYFSPPEGARYPRVHVGGTLSANPLSCVGGYYTLLETEKRQACEKAAAAGDKLCKGIQKIFDRYELPFVVYNQLSIIHIDVVGRLNLTITDENREEVKKKLLERNRLLNEFGMALFVEGIVTLVGRRMYTSLADTDDIIDDVFIRLDRLFKNYC
jgi:glutamate-1-semialdehyde 2,1-aminomutase